MRRTLIPLALGVLASACATQSVIPDQPETAVQAHERRAHAPRPAYNLAGYPPASRDGYIDGCESAKRSEYARKDARRMADDPLYATGWNDGYSICGR